MNNNYLKIEGLFHTYRDKTANDWSLKSIDLDLKQGELIGLLGPSGCGKTTLLRLIAGFEKPCAGKIYIDSKIVANQQKQIPPEKRGLGMVFQDYALFPHLDAWQNVCFGTVKRQDIDRAHWLLEMLGLSKLINRYPHELSGGQKQRLALARALAPGTSLVLLDEPFSNLDVEVRLKLRSELSSVLNSCSASALLVTHDPQEALAICDRVAVMKEGMLHQCSSPTEIVANPATSFVGQFVLQRNIIPLKEKESYFNTILGKIDKKELNYKIPPRELLVDEKSIMIEINKSGDATIKSKEFQGNHWIIKIEIAGLLFRVFMSINEEINIGEKCRLRLRPGSTGILFPGGIGYTEKG